MTDAKKARLAAAKVRRTIDSYLRISTPLRAVRGALTEGLRSVAPEERQAVLESCVEMLVARAETETERPWLYPRAALIVANCFLAEGHAVPPALPLLIDSQTFDLAPWRPAFATLDDAGVRQVLAHLRGTIQPHLQGQLSSLRARVGDSPERLIEELEQKIRDSNSVNVGLLVEPFTALGDSAVDPLARRIEELTPVAKAYKERRIVLGLRNALAFAVVASERPVEELEEHFLLTPPELFGGNADYAYSFLRALPQSLFAKASERWVMKWLEVWRDSPAHQDEQEGLVKGLLPNERKRLFFQR